MENYRPETAVPSTESVKRYQTGFMILCLAAFLSSMDSAVNVAFPLIVSDFDIEVPQIRWIVISYILAVASLTIVFGKMGDLLGHKRVFGIGIAAAIFAYLLCALAPSYEFLIAFRFLQGVAQGLSMSCIVALMTLNVSPDEKRRVLALFVMIVGFGLAAGPAIGGILVDFFGWRSVFWVRAIIAGVILLGLGFVVAPDRNEQSQVSFDGIGAAMMFLLIGSAIALSVFATLEAVNPVVTVVVACVTVTIGWLFYRHECVHPSPILDMTHFADPTFSLIQVAAVVVNFCCFSIFLLMPFSLESLFQLEFLASGLALALMPFGMVSAGFLMRRISNTVTSVSITKLGLFLAAIGLIAVGFAAQQRQLTIVCVAMYSAGLGLGLFKAGCVDFTTTLLPPEQRGVAGSIYNVTQVFGFVLGASFLTGLSKWFSVGSVVPGREYSMTILTVGIGLLMTAIAFGMFMMMRPKQR